MTKYINSVAMAAALTMGMTAGAHAASFTLIDAGGGALQDGSIPGGSATNEVLPALGLGASIDGFFGTAVEIEGDDIRVRAEFFGWEAGFTNDFNLFGSEIFSTGSGGDIETTDINNPLDTFISAYDDFAANTLLDFSFDTDSDDVTITNGDINVGERGFFATFGDDQTTTGTVLWLFLDDSGAGPDDNHDDLVVRLTIEQVPVPAAGFLLIGALGALGVAKRRSRKKA